MKIFKKALAAVTALSITLSTASLVSFAESDDWVFIDGENITRQLNMAVIYKGIETTGQNQWGYDIVIDAENEVTQIIEGGEAEGGNLAVPEGGAVISAGGTKIDWFKENIEVGDTVYYDGYSQRLFICDWYGDFDPYFSETFDIAGEENAYQLSNSEASEASEYTYKIAVDAEGTVVARGGNVTTPEGGFTVEAATEADRASLVMFALLGAECEIYDGEVTFSYNSSMLSTTASLAIAKAKQKADTAKAEFAYIDTEALDAAIADAEAAAAEISDYEELSELMVSLEDSIDSICSDNGIYELRGAFHIPTEKNETEVSATVLSAKAAGLNSIILRVTNGYGTFIPMPEGSRFMQDEKFGGFDVLKSFIDVCKKENVALSLCIETYYNEYASIAAPEWLSNANGTEAGLANKYYSPAAGDFKSYFVQYVEYIITHYEIDSLMFDYLRYPKFNEEADLGYDYNTLQMFSSQYSIPITEVDALKTELSNSPHWEKWVEFKSGLIDDMAKTLSETVRAKRADITLTAVAERDNIDYYYMQDSTSWIENGWFDGLTVAVYEADSAENDSLPENAYYGGIIADKGSEFTNIIGSDAYVFMGIDSSDALGADALKNAIGETRAIGADGFVFSKLSDFIAQNYHISLKNNVLRGTSVSPLGDEVYAMKKILEYSKLKINDSILKSDGCSEEAATQANGVIDTAMAQLESGILTIDRATMLEIDIESIFTESAAKNSVMREYKAITKLASLAKAGQEEFTPPPAEESVEESSQPEIPEENPEVQESEANSVEESSPDTSSRIEINIDFGKVLIYGFVGIAFAAAIAAMIVGIRRKNTRPANHHMPKGSAEGYENKNTDSES